MKQKNYLLLLLLICFTAINAQNVGIGTNEPYNKLHVVGNMVVSALTFTTSAAPTAAQTHTMINASTIVIGGDSIARIYDPGGPAGNYLPNLLSRVSTNVQYSNCYGLEVSIESIGLGTGDSLLFYDADDSVTLAIGAGNMFTGKTILNVDRGEIKITFKSNSDASVGTGFSLVVKRLFSFNQNINAPDNFSGNTLSFYANKGALRVGRMDNSFIGFNSFATGNRSVASGGYSFASGADVTASGTSSTAIGYLNSATGDYSLSGGFGSNAEGWYSVALGTICNAMGRASTSLGYYTSSNGFAGTAIGLYNNPILTTAQTSISPITPLFIIGNGSDGTPSNAMVVLKNGNIGIGSDAPGFPLNFASSTGDKISLWGNTGNHYGFGIQGNLMQIHTDAAASDVAFGHGRSAAFTETMRIKGNGNVGIGTSVPSERLHVIGNILASGTITPSDLRYKKNIQPIPNSLQKLLLLNGVSYNMRQEEFPEWQFDDKKQYGLIAQEVEKVFPEMVKTIDPTNDYKGVDYVKLIPVLLEAIKELKKENEEQQKQIDLLKNKR